MCRELPQHLLSTTLCFLVVRFQLCLCLLQLRFSLLYKLQGLKKDTSACNVMELSHHLLWPCVRCLQLRFELFVFLATSSRSKLLDPEAF